MRYPRILFYAVNGLGLGHVTRLLAIGRELRKRLPEAELVYFTSSEAEDVIFREGFAAFKVPSRSLRTRSGIRPSTYARMLHTVTLNLIASFHPHVIVVDTFPAGSLQELLPILRWDARKVFVFREQRPEAALSPVFQNALRLYDLALIPHTRGTTVIQAPEDMESVWTGPILIRDRDSALDREEARARLGLTQDGAALYLTFGGGGDPAMDAAMALSIDALAGRGRHLAVAHAPLFNGRIPQREGVTVLHHYPMAEMYRAFDGAISAAGYNSSMELLHHGVPTALVPFPRQVDDQLLRAQTLAAAGAALCVDPFTADSVCAAAQELLDPARAAELSAQGRQHVPANGATAAADAIAELIS